MGNDWGAISTTILKNRQMKYTIFIIGFIGFFFIQITSVSAQPDMNIKLPEEYIQEGKDYEKDGKYIEAYNKYLLAYDFGNEAVKETVLNLMRGIASKQNQVIADRNLALEALEDEKIKVENERNEKEIQRKKAVKNEMLARQKSIQVEALRLPLLADSLRQMGHADALKVAFLGLKLNEDNNFPAGWKAFATALIYDEEHREALGTSSTKIDYAQLLLNQEKLLIQTDNRLEILY